MTQPTEDRINDTSLPVPAGQHRRGLGLWVNPQQDAGPRAHNSVELVPLRPWLFRVRTPPTRQARVLLFASEHRQNEDGDI